MTVLLTLNKIFRDNFIEPISGGGNSSGKGKTQKIFRYHTHCLESSQLTVSLQGGRSGGLRGWVVKAPPPQPTMTSFHRKWLWINKNTRRPYLNGVAVRDSFWCENKWNSLIYCSTYLCINQTETLPRTKFVFIEKWLPKQKLRKMNFGLRTKCFQNKYFQSFVQWSIYFLNGFHIYIWETNKEELFLIYGRNITTR